MIARICPAMSLIQDRGVERPWRRVAPTRKRSGCRLGARRPMPQRRATGPSPSTARDAAEPPTGTGLPDRVRAWVDRADRAVELVADPHRARRGPRGRSGRPRPGSWPGCLRSTDRAGGGCRRGGSRPRSSRTPRARAVGPVPTDCVSVTLSVRRIDRATPFGANETQTPSDVNATPEGWPANGTARVFARRRIDAEAHGPYRVGDPERTVAERDPHGTEPHEGLADRVRTDVDPAHAYRRRHS